MNLFQISKLYAANNEEHARLSEEILSKVKDSVLAQTLFPYTVKLAEVLYSEKESLLASRQSLHTERIKDLYRQQALYRTVIKKSITFFIKTGSEEQSKQASRVMRIYDKCGLNALTLKTNEMNESVSKFIKQSESKDICQIVDSFGVRDKINELKRMNAEAVSLLEKREIERKTSKKCNAEPLRKATDNIISLIDAKLQTLRFEQGSEDMEKMIKEIQEVLN
ncbi:MAG: DUF6261 family protein [Paludibacteraceae bacterium]|nr:DUF6261 family protein [Paludibacteraceae bacterium]